MKYIMIGLVFVIIVMFVFVLVYVVDSVCWLKQQVVFWYVKQVWLVGSNYLLVNVINELEMWQVDIFDLVCIDKELGWVQKMGMIIMCVFLYDLLWKQDVVGFKQCIDVFLMIVVKYYIKLIFVLFDFCWDFELKFGEQYLLIFGVYNLGWVQLFGVVMDDLSQYL